MDFLSYDVTHPDADHAEITVKVPGQEVGALVQDAYRAMEQQAGIQGHMPTKKLRARLLREHGYSEDELDGMLRDLVLARVTPFAIDRLDQDVITEPSAYCLEQPEAGRDLIVYIRALLKPAFELESCEPVTCQIPRIEFSEEDVDAQLRDFAEKSATFEENGSAEPLALGDYARIDLTVSKDGRAVPALSRQGNLFQCSYDTMPEGFIDQVVGMVPDEWRRFTFMGPREGASSPDKLDEYTAEVRLVCHLDRKVPEVTDEWFAMNYPLFKSLEDFRANIRNDLRVRAEEQDRQIRDAAVNAALVERLQGHVPDEIYEFALSNMMAGFMGTLQQRGQTREQFFQEQGISEREFNTGMMLQARQGLRQSFALDALFRGLGMELDDADIDEALHEMAPGHEEDVRREAEETGRMFAVRDEARRCKAKRWLLETATWEFVDPQPQA